MRTLEQKIKFDSGLSIGQHLVRIHHQNKSILALVSIGARGKVELLRCPRDEDMYSIWERVTGDTLVNSGSVIVWAARDPGFMTQFEGDPVASIFI